MTENLAAIDDLKVPSWFWVVAGVAFVWNLLGVMAFIDQMTMTDETLAKMSLPEQALYAATPIWAVIAFGLAVFSGAFGALLLLMKKSLSFYLFVISFCAICLQMFHAFFMVDSFAVFGPGGTIMPILVIIFAIGLICFTKIAISKEWLI